MINIKVNFSVYSSLNDTKTVLHDILNKYDLVACDFEAASIYTDEEKEIIEVKKRYTDEDDWETIRNYDAMYNSDGLSNVRLINPTHLSVAWSECEAVVFVLNDHNTIEACNQLVSSKAKQIWHNASYDFGFIYKYTGKYPKNYEDSELLVKCLTNHVKSYKAPAKLKQLEGAFYGKWGIAKENFNQKNRFDKDMLEYSATDACATYHLYQRILKDLYESDTNRSSSSEETV